MRAKEGNPRAHAPPLTLCGPSAGMAELVDALDSKSSSGNRVGVRFPLPAPSSGMTAPIRGRFHSIFIVHAGITCFAGLMNIWCGVSPPAYSNARISRSKTTVGIQCGLARWFRFVAAYISPRHQVYALYRERALTRRSGSTFPRSKRRTPALRTGETTRALGMDFYA